MSRASVTRRLLRKLTFTEVKHINNHFDLQPRKSKDELIGQIVHEVGTNLQTLVSNKGPFSLIQWNETVAELGGSPRKSFEAVAEEIEASLDPVFDELDGDTSIVELRSDKAALRSLAGKLGIDREDLEISISSTNGNTLLSTFVTGVRTTQNKQTKGEPRTPDSMRVASTLITADSIEKLSQSWMIDHLAGADDIFIAAGFYDVEFIKTLLHKHPTVQRVRLLFNGLGGRRLKAQRQELQKLENFLRIDGRAVDIRLAFAPGLFHSKLFLMTEGGSTRALVGSANATRAAFERNEEILVALDDAEALAGYFDSAWNKASALDQIDTTARSLIAFFRTGILYFKPVASLTTTLNPFRELLKLMTNDELARLGGVSLPHADQETGIGSFNLKLAVKGNFNEEVMAKEGGVSDAGQATKASIKPWSVETCFGYWVPFALEDAWTKKLEEAGEQKKKKWVAFRNELHVVPEGELIRMYGEYLDAVEKALEVIPTVPDYRAKLRQNPFDKSVFTKFLERVKMYLEDETRLNRLALPFTSGAIPEIWDDDLAYEDFRTTFFDYLDQVARLGSNRPAVPKKILKMLNIDESPGSEQLLLQFKEYLNQSGWTDAHWK